MMRWVLGAMVLTGCTYTGEQLPPSLDGSPDASSSSTFLIPPLEEFPPGAGVVVVGVRLHADGDVSLKGAVHLESRISPGAPPARTCLGAQVGAPAGMVFAGQPEFGVHLATDGRTVGWSQAVSDTRHGHSISMSYPARAGEVVPVVFVLSDALNASARGAQAELRVNTSAPAEIASVEFLPAHCVMSLDQMQGGNLARVAGVTRGTDLTWEHPDHQSSVVWVMVRGNGGFQARVIQAGNDVWSTTRPLGDEEASVFTHCCLSAVPWRLDVAEIAGTNADISLAVVGLPAWAAAAISAAVAELSAAPVPSETLAADAEL